MDGNLFNYIEQLQVIAFFSGYPLIYSAIFFFVGKPESRTAFKKQIVAFLPMGYALVGTLYFGLLLRDLYPDYSMEHIKAGLNFSFLKLWGLCSLLFWIPWFQKKPLVSLLHSLVFFSLIIKDFYVQLSSSDTDKNVLKNDMKVYTDSIILNVSTFIVVLIIYLLISFFKKKIRS